MDLMFTESARANQAAAVLESERHRPAVVPVAVILLLDTAE